MQSAKVLGAGVVVYFVVAACSGAVTDRGGTAESGISEIVRGAIDGIGNSTPIARAAPEAGSAPQVDGEPCSVQVNDGSMTHYWAEHAYPGKTKAELAGVSALMHIAGTHQGVPAGYGDYIAERVYVRDGAVAVECYVKIWPSDPAAVTGVTFFKP